MNIGLAIYTIITLYVGAELGYYLYYSPKATVNRLLKQMRRILIKMARKARGDKDMKDYYYKLCKVALESRYKVINDLLNLEYNFNQEENKNYIQEKRELSQMYLDNLRNIFNEI